MRILRCLLAVILSALVSPVILRHACGLTSWPLEWAVCLLSVSISLLVVARAEKKWVAWTLALVAAPALSLAATLALGELLHWRSLPVWVYDGDGKKWIEKRGR